MARLVADQVKEPLGLWAVLARDYVVCGPRRFAQTFAHALADPVETKLHHVQVPAIVTRGERDSIVPRAWAKELADGLPNGELIEVPRAPHALNWSAPNELADIVRRVL
jgi:pimeloyl-ACP methyl ester carboxylesterase